MNILLISHITKLEMLAQFCVSQQIILCQQKLMAPVTVARRVESASQLHISRRINEDREAYQQITPYIACGEVDFVIFFRDLSDPDQSCQAENCLLRMCDKRHIPIATNYSTAELLIRSVQLDPQGWNTISKNIC